MDMIDLLPPGLYEAVITGLDARSNTQRWRRVIPVYAGSAHGRANPRYRRRFPRGRSALRHHGPSVGINQGLYRTFVSPLMRMAATEQSASELGQLHPNRLRFEMFADANPWD